MPRLQCPRCPGQSQSQLALKHHLLGHSAPQCARCRKSFSHRHLLLRHRRGGACRPAQPRAPLGRSALRDGLVARPRLRDTAFIGQGRAEASLYDAELSRVAETSAFDATQTTRLTETSAFEPDESTTESNRTFQLPELTLSIVVPRLRVLDDLRCPTCDKLFADRERFRKHVRLTKECGSERPRYVCSKCSAAYHFPVLLSRHEENPLHCAKRLRRQELAGLSLPVPETQSGTKRASIACRGCGKTFGWLSVLGKHLQSSRSCPKYQRQRELAKFADPTAPKEGSFSCRGCGKTFRHLSSLGYHAESLGCKRRQRQMELTKMVADDGTDEVAVSCKGCGKTFTWLSTLGKHLQSPISCERFRRHREIASGVSETKASQDPDKTQEHNAKLTQHTCSKCAKDFGNWRALYVHRSHGRSCGDRAGRFPCEKCDRAFPFKNLLTVHQKSQVACLRRRQQLDVLAKIPDGSGKTCPKCGKAFRFLALLRTHLDSPLACKIRLRRQEILSSLPRTAQNEASANETQQGGAQNIQHTCSKCGKDFRHWRGLYSHLSESRSCGDRAERFRCAQCGRTFAFRNELKRHHDSPTACLWRQRRTKRMASTGESNTCLKCCRSFASASRLTAHLIGTRSCGDRAASFVCADCGATFPFQSVLAKHRESDIACAIRRRQAARATLTGAGNSCVKCGRAFESPYKLARHLSLTMSCGDASARYRCEGCGRAFAAARRLADHCLTRGACQGRRDDRRPPGGEE